MSLAKKLHPFEFVGAYKLFTEERFLLADDMGMFKTAQSIFANSKFREKRRNIRTLVVCPTSVKEHWAREVNKWAYPKNLDINIINTSTAQDDLQKAKHSEWNIIHYALLSQFDNSAVRKIRNIGFDHIIIDEVHNAKNPYAIRTKAIKTLADQCDYLSLLSGTPIPNTLADLYTLMSLLDPQQYPLHPSELNVARQSFLQLYLDHPQAVKELLHRKMLRRTAQDYVGEDIPQLNLQRIPLPLTGTHLETYQSILEENMNVGKKIMLLAQASIDPLLVNPSLRRSIRGKDASVKYEFLDDLVKCEVEKKDGKVLIFTNLKEGIVDFLAERYEEYGVVTVTGDVPTEGGLREELRMKFQHDPHTRIIVATTTMNEGVDLTAATAVVNLTIPWTPAEYYQRYKRSQRPGEKKKDRVDVYVPYIKIPGAQDSLEEASLKMLDGKEKIIKYLTSGLQVSREELQELSEPHHVPTIMLAIKSPNKAIFEEFIRWRGVGSRQALKWMKHRPARTRYISELYPGFGMARNAADQYLPVIKKLERGAKLTPKLDLACGPGMLSYFSGEPAISIDLNQEMLKVGKREYQTKNLIAGSMSHIPLVDKSIGLIVCSLAFQMTEPRVERARTLQEMSRILKPRGYAIITLPPHYLSKNDETVFGRAMKSYGLRIKQHETMLSKSQLEMYVIQKCNDAQDKLIDLTFGGDPLRKP